MFLKLKIVRKVDGNISDDNTSAFKNLGRDTQNSCLC